MMRGTVSVNSNTDLVAAPSAMNTDVHIKILHVQFLPYSIWLAGKNFIFQKDGQLATLQKKKNSLKNETLKYWREQLTFQI